MTQPIIRIEGLTRRYGTTEALRGVSFEVPKGQVVGFLGPNGAGKSTTMKILAGYLSPTTGKAFVGGIDVTIDPVKTRSMIGYLPESNPLYEDMMVLEYLEFVADLRQLKGARRKERLNVVVERCGLKTALGKDIVQLSKGFRQRVGLAQAILHDPDLLILDEPTSGLDPNQIVEIRQLIQELGKEKTVILSTHILSEVQSTCGRVLIINDGKLVADDAPDRLSADQGGLIHLVVASRLGVSVDGAMLQAALSQVPGVLRVDSADNEGANTYGFTLRYGSEDPRRALNEVLFKHELTVLELRRHQQSLEDAFRRLTTSATQVPVTPITAAPRPHVTA